MIGGKMLMKDENGMVPKAPKMAVPNKQSSNQYREMYLEILKREHMGNDVKNRKILDVHHKVAHINKGTDTRKLGNGTNVAYYGSKKAYKLRNDIMKQETPSFNQRVLTKGQKLVQDTSHIRSSEFKLRERFGKKNSSAFKPKRNVKSYQPNPKATVYQPKQNVTKRQQMEVKKLLSQQPQR